jgi:hypothetical protein
VSKMAARKNAGRKIEERVFIASRRRCCLCVFLNDRNDVRQGQIAHLNRDRSDSRFENLVFLCLEHHNDYDTRTHQSKGFSLGEVRQYRERLYRKYPNEADAAPTPHVELKPLAKIAQHRPPARYLQNQLGAHQNLGSFLYGKLPTNLSSSPTRPGTDVMAFV